MSSDSSSVNSVFSFIWGIENIDVCFYKETITSPTFVANNLNQTEWCMSLHPLVEENKFLLVLTRTDGGKGAKNISIDFSVSVTTSDGIPKVQKKKTAEFQSGSSNTSYWIYGSPAVLYGKNLTVFCHMQKNEKHTSPSIYCLARTIIGKEERCGVWKVKDFRRLSSCVTKNFTLYSTEKQSPHIEISGLVSRKSRFIHIQLQVDHDNPIFIVGKMSLLTANGESKWSIIEIFNFVSSIFSQTYKFPLILKQENLAPEYPSSQSRYLPVLSLICEFNISTGKEYSEIMETSYLTEDYLDLTHRELSKNKSEELSLDAENEDTDDIKISKKKSEELSPDSEDEDTDDVQISVDSHENHRTPQTLREDFKKLYRQKKHCDITLQVEKKSFPAHKSILCSRSSVFSSMFDHDMKEAINKKVEIVDMDADTMDRFLLFLYSETLEDLHWNRATKLLYAANKYQVESLKDECSSFLMLHLSLSNVCEALELADLYQDDQLRTKCQDFILENAAEIFSSKEWEKFTIGNPLLSAKMLQRYFSMKK